MGDDIKDFNFYQFLLDISNQSLDPIQGNEKFNDLVKGMESIFNKLYKRVQEVSIINTLNIKSNRDFTKYIENNEKTNPDLSTSPYNDILLEQLSIFLNTDHFKESVAVMMRLWQERANSHGMLGMDHENLESFIEDHIIPSFRFFTINAGDLHKSKGVKALLKRLFLFYGQVDEADVAFDDVVEHDRDDSKGRRYKRYTSPREGITVGSLLRNYKNIPLFQNMNLKISNYIELETHRFTLADGYLFISRKDREDWHIINIVDDVYRINNKYLGIKQLKTISLYSDEVSLYAENGDFILPEVDPNIIATNVEFVPKVINTSDKFNQYHTNNLYYVERTPVAGIPDRRYSLKRIRHNTTFDTLSIELIQYEMGITYLDLLYVPSHVYPRVTSIASVDYIWFDFYDEADESFEFYPNTLIPYSLSPVKFAYSFTIDQITKIAEDSVPEGFVYPTGRYVCVTRDGFNYEHRDEGFYYSVLSEIDVDQSSKYILQEREIGSTFQTELDQMFGDATTARAALDLFVPSKFDITEKYNYVSMGSWDADNASQLPPSSSPSDGEYWVVSNAGNVRVNGIEYWEPGNIIVWNGKLNQWEKNNEIANILGGTITKYGYIHQLVAIGTDEFLGDTGKIKSPYEEANGFLFTRFSNIILDIESLAKIIYVDSNPIEKFGNNPDVIFSYYGKTTQTYLVYSVKMDGFAREHEIVDMNRVLKGFPGYSAYPSITKIEITDKHLIVYVDKYERVENSKSTAIICENTNYNLPFGIRSNKANVSYNADVRLDTRERQKYFNEYIIQDGVAVPVEDEEVDAFKLTLDRYAPINVNTDFIQADINVGISSQNIADGEMVDSFPIVVNNYGIKEIKEISNLSYKDLFSLSTLGDPDDINCDCALQRTLLTIIGFNALSIYYDYDAEEMSSGVQNFPACLNAKKIGRVSDIYSRYNEVCRFDTGWFFYLADMLSDNPKLIRQRLRINLFDKVQVRGISIGSEGNTFNWSLVSEIQVLSNDNLSTVPESNWIPVSITESLMPQNVNGECNPIGSYWLCPGSGSLDTISQCNYYNVLAATVNTSSPCTHVPEL
jgi:hypothetical protein